MTLAKHPAVPAHGADDSALVEALRRGDEAAFAALVERHHGSMKRVARAYVSSDAVAEEVVQETWLGVLAGIHGFEGRASTKTWIFRILVNRARTRGSRERRTVPFSALARDGDDDGLSAVEERFHEAGHSAAGHWAAPPRAWQDPLRRAASLDTRSLLREAVAGLPPAQRLVVAMRDVEGFTSAETCELLGVSAANQRVLLHRARSKLRRVLEDELA